MENLKSNYLGIDWGAVNVGIALAHNETRIAVAFTTLKNDRELLRRLADIVTVEGVGTVVIGIPSYVNREEVEYEGEKLGWSISKQLGVAVAYQNEMFTTKMAQANLIERGAKHISKHDDAEAARIILHEWLETDVKSRRGLVP